MASGQAKQRVFTGEVTKMHDNFGFIDEDVFFQLGSCDGKVPTVGDRVMVEAQFNPNMPFKWHASHVKLVGRQTKPNRPVISSLGSGVRYNPRPQFPPQGLKFVQPGPGAGILGAAPVNVMNQHLPQQRRQQIQGGKARKRNAPRPAARKSQPSPPPPRQSKEKDSKKRRTGSPSSHHGSSDKTPRRPAPRYMVQYSKRVLTRKTSNVLSLKHLHHSLYIPSDFFSVKYDWQESFTLKQPVTPGKCQFHIFNKEVTSPVSMPKDKWAPPDADHSWVAKVMLLQAPSKDETYQQCCRLAGGSTESFTHQSRIYKFLIGTKNKKEMMAIGGSWSPSLDGPDPGTNPLTLVNTAMRTCKALIGIDLSKCTQWRRVLEIQYHRGTEVHKGRTVPDRVETTVIFLPDIHSCMLNLIEYESLRTDYAAECEAHIKFEQDEAIAECKISEIPVCEVNASEEKDNDAAAISTDKPDETSDQKETETAVSQEVCKTPVKEVDTSLDESMEVENENKSMSGSTPTPYSIIDVKNLKVILLRKELEARGLSPRGLKLALVERLTEAVEEEARKESVKIEIEENQIVEVKKEEVPIKEEVDEDVMMKEVEENDSIVVKEITEEPENGEKVESQEKLDVPIEGELEEPKQPRKIDVDRMRRHYISLPDSHPVVAVHPNSEFKKGNFDCSITSLYNLLTYRQEDNKESIFEVSVFAEAFTAMLQRGHAFNIYKALSNPLPQLELEKEEEKEEQKEEAKEEKDDDDEPKAKKTKSESENSESKEKKEEQETADKSEEQTEKMEGDKKENRDRTQSQESKDDKKSSSKDKDVSADKSEPVKMVTLRKDLLLSFVYFDTTQCGYIKTSDMREILYSIGIGLSRNQITKLLSKYVEHDNLKYRKLTDIPESQFETYKELLENAGKTDLDALIAGNDLLTSKITVSNGEVSRSKPVVSDGIVVLDGAVVDVRSLQESLASSEDNRSGLESQLLKLKNELDSANKQLTEIQTEKKSLEWDFISTKKKLGEIETNMKATTETKNKFEKTLKNITRDIETALPETKE